MFEIFGDFIKEDYLCSIWLKLNVRLINIAMFRGWIIKLNIELQNLTQIEEMLIVWALPIMRVYIKPGGQRGFSGLFYTSHFSRVECNSNDR